jgi:uncharacterized protein (TIGR00304 family)
MFATASRTSQKMKELDSLSITQVGFMLIIFGFVLAFLVMIVMAFRGAGNSGKTRSAGLILIGPIPIIFGNDKESVKVVMVLAIILIALVLTFMLLPNLLSR